MSSPPSAQYQCRYQSLRGGMWLSACYMMQMPNGSHKQSQHKSHAQCYLAHVRQRPDQGVLSRPGSSVAAAQSRERSAPEPAGLGCT